MGKLFAKLLRHEQMMEEENNKTGESLREKADSMQEVVPNIFMGPETVAANLELLETHGITHVLAIGWNLEKHFPEKFEYLVLNQIEDRPGFFLIPFFERCFEFMDDCITGMAENGSGNKLFVHCHKGLSRSASIIIAYEMRKKKTSFREVYDLLRESRSFIMPNIGFQAQLEEFEKRNYSLDMEDYKDLDIYDYISKILPNMLGDIKHAQLLYAKGRGNEVSGQMLFEFTMYFHQVDMLNRSKKLKHDKDTVILYEAIQCLRDIQVEYVKIPTSISRFDKLFRLDENGKPIAKVKTTNQSAATSKYVESVETPKTVENKDTLNSAANTETETETVDPTSNDDET